MIQGPPNTPIPLQLTVEPAYADRGVLATIRKQNGDLVDIVELSYAGLGAYTASFSHAVEEYLIATFVIYTDSTYATIDDTLARTSEIYRIKADPITPEDLPKPRYENRMTTVFNTTTGEHEVLCWADKDGQRRLTVEDCTIIVKTSAGAVAYTDFSATANTDGVFRFNRVFPAAADSNYYVIISIKVDGEIRTSYQSFFTLG